jgi:GrpB-like predicted nucleotidyltransferase (UPF0157 family)
VDLVTEEEIRDAVAVEFERCRVEIEALLPNADVEHIGATAVPGSLTKGDLDVLVRVPSREFGNALAVLGSEFTIHQRENWTGGFASFTKETASDVPVGVQLVVADGDEDHMFIGWRGRLIADPDLLDRYNDLKLSRRNGGPDEYRAAKGEFIAAELTSL